MNDVMHDLETMGVGPGAAIVAIGAVEFDPDTGKLGREFYQEIRLEDSVAAGGVIDASTVLWWMQQSDDARAAVYNKGGVSLLAALIQFAQWLRACGPDVKLWGNGAAFDNVILRNAYGLMRMAPPWDHRNDRCYRTLKNLRPGIELVRGGTHHNALDDAISQARRAVAILSDLYQGGIAPDGADWSGDQGGHA